MAPGTYRTKLPFGDKWSPDTYGPPDGNWKFVIHEFLFRGPTFPAIKITDSNGTVCIVKKKAQ